MDIHKKTIAYCLKKSDGEIVDEGKLKAIRGELRDWAESHDYRWIGGMKETQHRVTGVNVLKL